MNNDIKFLNIDWRPRYPLANFENHFGLYVSVIFLVFNMRGFLHMYIGVIPKSSGQLAEIILYIIPPE